MISEDNFRLARRNSMASTFFLFTYYYTQADLSEIGIFGVKWGAIDAVRVVHLMWMVWAFYFFRYYQFIKSYGDEKFKMAKGKVLRDILWERYYPALKLHNVDFEKHTRFAQGIRFQLITRRNSHSNKPEGAKPIYFFKNLFFYRKKKYGKGINLYERFRYNNKLKIIKTLVVLITTYVVFKIDYRYLIYIVCALLILKYFLSFEGVKRILELST